MKIDCFNKDHINKYYAAQHKKKALKRALTFKVTD